MTPPRRRATIKDLAAAVGVAPSTVSNAYNRPDQLSADLRRRILAAADALGYAGPDPAARGLRTRRTGAVAVLLGGPLGSVYADPVTAATLAGIAAELADDPAGAALALTLVPSAPATAAGPAGRVPRRSEPGPRASPPGPRPAGLPAADGLIVLCDDPADPLHALARRAHGPLVLVDDASRRGEEGERRKDASPAVPSSLLPQPSTPTRVGVDDALAARSAAGHLLALGHLHVAILTDHAPGRRPSSLLPPPSSSGRVAARLQGYRLGVEAVGLAWADVPVVGAGADTEAAGRAAALALLSADGRRRPTALLATSDALAVGALAAARELGVAVPTALSVVGFDDTLARPTTPALTTVRQPHLLKGRAAARALLAQLRGDSPPAAARLLPKLVVRGSSGPVAQEEEG